MKKCGAVTLTVTVLILAGCAGPTVAAQVVEAQPARGLYRAPLAVTAPVVDGVGNDVCWARAPWAPVDQLWVGEPVTATDFSGRYKVVWTPQRLYVLAEIKDDVLRDTHPDGLRQWPDDDCVEVFLDEDRSGGEHTYSYNAFAYHVALDYRVVDMGTDRRPHYYNDHVTARRNEDRGVYTWELALDVYDDTYQDGSDANRPVTLNAGKVMGFAIAYCDNDASEKRESFIGSVEIEGEDKNRGWQDAGVFGAVELTSELDLPSVLSDNMVLQRDVPVRVWGWAPPGEEVTVGFAGDTATATAGQDCTWQVELPAVPANDEPAALSVSAAGASLEVSNVLVGDVWLCSGQSNMAFAVRGSEGGQQAASEAARETGIRLFRAPNVVSGAPQADAAGRWQLCSPSSVAGFSAVGYYFGRELHRHLGVPVGLIHTAWGGTPAQSWMPMPALLEAPGGRERVDDSQRSLEAWYNEEATRQREAETAKWREAVARARAERQTPPRMPAHLSNPHTSAWRPCSLYNAMIHPFTPMGLRGFIWYQGESNAGEASDYHELLSALIRSWRAAWGRGDLPFLFVQLPNFLALQTEPVEDGSSWAVLREEQVQTLSLPATGMPIIIDVGEADDIHPRNKLDVGRRLALVARAVAYGEDLVYSGPLYEGMEKGDGRIVLRFKHVGDGLKARDGGELKGFAVAGPDGQWAWAHAEIEGDTVVVSSADVADPVGVRYSWANNPVGNLVNSAGLPASPFRTDDW